MNQDEHHLYLLSIFHYVVGALVACCACVPVLHFGIGLFFLLAPEETLDEGGGPPARLVGLLFTLLPGVMIVGGWIFAGCVVYAGRCLAARRRYLYCLVIAGLLCSFMPVGTLLGVLTIIVLAQPRVKQMFEVTESKEAAWKNAGDPFRRVAD